MGIRVNKQKDAFVTTALFFNLVFLFVGIFYKKMFYFSIGTTLFFLIIYYIMRIFEDKLEIILEASSLARKVTDILK